jgi:hypothetical protein
MITSTKMPPIIGPIMIPMFVDLDVGDPNIGFPGAYMKVQSPLWEIRLGGMGPLKLLFCISKSFRDGREANQAGSSPDSILFCNCLMYQNTTTFHNIHSKSSLSLCGTTLASSWYSIIDREHIFNKSQSKWSFKNPCTLLL